MIRSCSDLPANLAVVDEDNPELVYLYFPSINMFCPLTVQEISRVRLFPRDRYRDVRVASMVTTQDLPREYAHLNGLKAMVLKSSSEMTSFMVITSCFEFGAFTIQQCNIRDVGPLTSAFIPASSVKFKEMYIRMMDERAWARELFRKFVMFRDENRQVKIRNFMEIDRDTRQIIESSVRKICSFSMSIRVLGPAEIQKIVGQSEPSPLGVEPSGTNEFRSGDCVVITSDTNLGMLGVGCFGSIVARTINDRESWVIKSVNGRFFSVHKDNIEHLRNYIRCYTRPAPGSLVGISENDKFGVVIDYLEDSSHVIVEFSFPFDEFYQKTRVSLHVNFVKELDGVSSRDVLDALSEYNEIRSLHSIYDEIFNFMEDLNNMAKDCESMTESIEQRRSRGLTFRQHPRSLNLWLGIKKLILTINQVIIWCANISKEEKTKICSLTFDDVEVGDCVIMDSRSLVIVEAVIFGRFYVLSCSEPYTEHFYVHGSRLQKFTNAVISLNVPRWFTEWNSFSLNQMKNRLDKARRAAEIIEERTIDETISGCISELLCDSRLVEPVLNREVGHLIGRVIDILITATQRLEQQLQVETVRFLDAYAPAICDQIAECEEMHAEHVAMLTANAMHAAEIIEENILEEAFSALISDLCDDPDVCEMVLNQVVNSRTSQNDSHVGRIIDILITTSRLLEQQIQEETASFLEAYLGVQMAAVDDLIIECDESHNRFVEMRAAEAAAAAGLAHEARLAGLVQEGIAWDLTRLAFPEMAFHLMDNDERLAYRDADDDFSGMYCNICTHPIDVLDPAVRTVMCCGGNFQVCGNCRGNFEQLHAARNDALGPDGRAFGHRLVLSDSEHLRQGLVTMRAARRR